VPGRKFPSQVTIPLMGVVHKQLNIDELLVIVETIWQSITFT
jgi:hypothetical protein